MMQMVGVDDAVDGVEYLYPNPPGPGGEDHQDTEEQLNWTT